MLFENKASIQLIATLSEAEVMQYAGGLMGITVFQPRQTVVKKLEPGEKVVELRKKGRLDLGQFWDVCHGVNQTLSGADVASRAGRRPLYDRVQRAKAEEARLACPRR